MQALIMVLAALGGIAGWALITYLVFDLVWNQTDDPLIAVRWAHCVAGFCLALYFCLFWYPHFLQIIVGGPSYLCWIFAGVAWALFALVCGLTRQPLPVREGDVTKA